MENMEHLFIHGESAGAIWDFLAKTFDISTPRNLRYLQQIWFLPHNKKDFMSCIQLCLATCALWEIWVYRNRKLMSKPTTDLKDIFHIPTLMSNIKGRWQQWIPNSSGMSLSCAVNCCHCGGIVRDEKGINFYIWFLYWLGPG
ncbi:hypothetical protein QQ045_002389 [Rhodiola kirilowii]